MVVILMRHGVRGCGIDSALATYVTSDLENSCPELWESVTSLIDGGVVESLKKIIVSPYLRTRQTAEVVQYAIMKLMSKYVPIVVDNRLGEYEVRKWSSWQAVPQLSEYDHETLLAYQGKMPLYRESADMLTLRVHNFYRYLLDSTVHTAHTENTLVISHKGIAELIGLFAGKKIELEMGGYGYLPTEVVRLPVTSSIVG